FRAEGRFMHPSAHWSIPEASPMSSFPSAASQFTPEPASGEQAIPLGPPPVQQPHATTEFLPREPANLEEAGLLASDVEALVLKLMLTSGAALGRKIAEQTRLPFGI